jgi:hypothetical protein
VALCILNRDPRRGMLFEFPWGHRRESPKGDFPFWEVP